MGASTRTSISSKAPSNSGSRGLFDLNHGRPSLLSIPSYLAARPSGDLLTAAHRKITYDWWEYRREVRAGNAGIAARRTELLEGIPVLELTDDVRALAELIIARRAIPARAAFATVYTCDFLLTWNCRHIANAEVLPLLARIAGDAGHDLPLVCTPEELMGGHDEGGLRL